MLPTSQSKELYEYLKSLLVLRDAVLPSISISCVLSLYIRVETCCRHETIFGIKC
jgi:hypothetical protein